MTETNIKLMTPPQSLNSGSKYITGFSWTVGWDSMFLKKSSEGVFFLMWYTKRQLFWRYGWNDECIFEISAVHANTELLVR